MKSKSKSQAAQSSPFLSPEAKQVANSPIKPVSPEHIKEGSYPQKFNPAKSLDRNTEDQKVTSTVSK